MDCENKVGTYIGEPTYFRGTGRPLNRGTRVVAKKGFELYGNRFLRVSPEGDETSIKAVYSSEIEFD